MKRHLRWVGILLPTVWISACSDPIEAAKPLLDAPVLTLREEWRIHGNRDLLGQIGWVVIGRSGEVFVGHDLDFRIIAFDSGGTRLGIFGGKGREPGSFEHLLRAGTLGDTLWVYDGILRRVTMFDPDLRVARYYRWPAAYTVQTLAESRDATVPYLLAITPGGATVASVYREPLTRLAADSLGVAYVPGGLYVPDGRRLLLSEEVPTNASFAGGVLVDNIRLFPADPIFAAASDGAAFVYVEAFVEGPQAGTFRVTRFNDAGDTTFVRQHPFYPVEIPPAAIERAVEQGVRRLQAGPRGSPEAVEAYRKAVRAPRHYPPVLGALPGRDGTTWLRMRPLVEDNSEYLVLGRGGELAGRLSVAESLEIVAAEGSRAWAIMTDSLGMQSIVRYVVDGISEPRDEEY